MVVGSQKGTYKNGELHGTIHYQKSNSPTTELALTEDQYKHVFRVECKTRNGRAIAWKYFNEESERVDINGALALTEAEFAKNVPGLNLPELLLDLLSFQANAGAGNYSQGFGLTREDQTLLEGYSKDTDLSKSLMCFASANGTGSCYAFWKQEGTALDQFPIVIVGDEGGLHVVAEDLGGLLQLLCADLEASVSLDEVAYSEDGSEPSWEAKSFRAWVKKRLGLSRITSPKRVVSMAQKKYGRALEMWIETLE